MTAWIDESDPLDVMKDLLDDNWVEYRDVPKPNLIIANEASEPFARFNLNDGDCIVIRADSPEQIRYRGTVDYYDRVFNITLDIWTKEDRQRLRNIWKMIKSIIFDKKHDFTGYQLIRLLNYQELLNETLNIWRGQIRLQVESAGVAVESLS